MKYMILIYDDGIFNNASVMMAVQAVCDHEVRFCNASMILDGALKDAKLFVIPGAPDLYYCEKLDGKRNHLIKEFVASGGAYLGICGGAYYACASLDWNKGEIDGSRELAFYNGTATGPVYDWIENPDNVYDGSWIYAPTLQWNDQEFTTCYDAGPVFSEPQDTYSQVIARYRMPDSTPPAIIQTCHKQGKVILSSCHIERFEDLASSFLYKHLNKSYARDKEQIDKILQNKQQQKELFQSIIKELLD